MLDPLVAVALGWLFASVVVGALAALFLAGAHRRERRLPETKQGVRAWMGRGAAQEGTSEAPETPPKVADDVQKVSL